MVEQKALSVFKYQTLVLTKLGIYPTEFRNENNLFFKSFSSYCVLFFLIGYVITGSAFVYVHLSDFTAALRAVIFVIGIGQAAGIYYCYGINVNKIQIVHVKIQEIIDEIVKSKRSKNHLRKITININEIFRFFYF